MLSGREGHSVHGSIAGLAIEKRESLRPCFPFYGEVDRRPWCRLNPAYSRLTIGRLACEARHIRNQSGDEIAGVLTISTLLWFSDMRILVLLPANAALPRTARLRVYWNGGIVFGHGQPASA